MVQHIIVQKYNLAKEMCKSLESAVLWLFFPVEFLRNNEFFPYNIIMAKYVFIYWTASMWI